MEKVFIEVHGGLIQNIQSTSADIEINVKDYDTAEPGDPETGWQYWKAKGGDKVVSNAEIEAAMLKSND